MLVETADLVTASHAAHLAACSPAQFQELLYRGQIQPMVTIDGLKFFHRREALALRKFVETMAGRRPSKPLPRLQELF